MTAVMHHDLHLRNLDRLPVSIRRVASLAAAETRTLAQVIHARDLMETPTLARSQQMAFLAVFFPVLDPARIPRLEELSAKAKEDVSCADVALNAMFQLRKQGDIGLSLWPRVWPWVDFIHTHRQQLEDRIEFLPEQDFYASFSLFLGSYFDHPATYELISAAPGFWACVVKFWTFLTQFDTPDHMLAHLGGFLAESGVRSHPERLEEMIDAAGSISRFAGLVEDFIRTVVKHHTSDAWGLLDNIAHITGFIDDADQFPQDCSGDPMSVPLGRLGVALYTHSNCAEELVAAVLFLCDNHEERATVAIDRCLMLVRRMIIASPAKLWLSKLFKRGLLRAFFLIALRSDTRGGPLEHQVLYFLVLVLSPALVSFDAVAAYRDALEEVQDLLLGDKFKKRAPKLYETWQTFLTITEERCEALTFVAQKACDNQECGLIQESSCLKRCSGCLVFYYCSVQCQRRDWELGHQNACHTRDNLLLSKRAELTFKERSFIRALTHRRYLKERHFICAQKISILTQYDGAGHRPDVLFTLFDYSKPAPVTKVYPVHLDNSQASDRVWSDDESDDEEPHEPLHELLDTESDEWQDLVKRAKLGKGRYELHGIRISEGSKMRTWVVPLRTDGDKRFEGLLRLSRRGFTQAADLIREIDFLVKSTNDLVEIH
ncbi:hypothetical protein FB45DRAFT_1009417 [Roridomyces roridus]|uniref:MYND-type domain-containing protein n=1 Tax=Roridomyces roridus TaxID=1738132 RepID=A0AAD7FAG9_9AGAR|nr:hypothetical protein FB45DRAFT_1009417 [Roridomyces roridus]